MAVTSDDVYRYYNDIVEPMYAEFLLRTSGKKLELGNLYEDAIASLAKGKKNGIGLAEKEEALSKARGYILDVALTIARALAELLAKEANAIASNKEKVKWCAQVSSDVVRSKQKRATALFRDATNRDNSAASNTEREAAVRLYESCAEAYAEWIEFFDSSLLSDFGAFSFKHYLKNNVISFVLGLISSGIIAFIAWKLLPTNCAQTEQVKISFPQQARTCFAPSTPNAYNWPRFAFTTIEAAQ